MSFLKDQQFNSIKLLVLVLILIGLGAFAYTKMHTNTDLDESGRVINTTKNSNINPVENTCSYSSDPNTNTCREDCDINGVYTSLCGTGQWDADHIGGCDNMTACPQAIHPKGGGTQSGL